MSHHVKLLIGENDGAPERVWCLVSAPGVAVVDNFPFYVARHGVRCGDTISFKPEDVIEEIDEPAEMPREQSVFASRHSLHADETEVTEADVDAVLADIRSTLMGRYCGMKAGVAVHSSRIDAKERHTFDFANHDSSFEDRVRIEQSTRILLAACAGHLAGLVAMRRQS